MMFHGVLTSPRPLNAALGSVRQGCICRDAVMIHPPASIRHHRSLCGMPAARRLRLPPAAARSPASRRAAAHPLSVAKRGPCLMRLKALAGLVAALCRRPVPYASHITISLSVHFCRVASPSRRSHHHAHRFGLRDLLGRNAPGRASPWSLRSAEAQPGQPSAPRVVPSLTTRSSGSRGSCSGWAASCWRIWLIYGHSPVGFGGRCRCGRLCPTRYWS